MLLTGVCVCVFLIDLFNSTGTSFSATSFSALTLLVGWQEGHMAQLMPLPIAVSCFSKIQIGFTFLVLAYPGSPGQRAVKRVCVCVYLI